MRKNHYYKRGYNFRRPNRDLIVTVEEFDVITGIVVNEIQGLWDYSKSITWFLRVIAHSGMKMYANTELKVKSVKLYKGFRV